MKEFTLKNCIKDGSAIAVCIEITAIILMLIYFYSDPKNTATWFQTVGSISAIILSSLAAIFQSERNLIQAQQLAQEEENKNLQAIKELISFCFNQLKDICSCRPETVYHPKDFIDFFDKPENEEVNEAWCRSAESFRAFSETLQMVKAINWKDYLTEDILRSGLFFSQMATNYMEQISRHAEGAKNQNKRNTPQQWVAVALFTDIEFHRDFPSWVEDLSKFYQEVDIQINNYLENHRVFT